MNASLRRRLFVWLSVAIVLVSASVAAISFMLAWREASDASDAQLRQVTASLATQHAVAPMSHASLGNGEDAEAHYVVRQLGSGGVEADPNADVLLPSSLPMGLQTLESRGVQWRVMVSRNASGQIFGVAQRLQARDESAQEAAMLTLVPMLVLVPLLLLIVHLLLRQGFAPLLALTSEVDRVDGSQLAELDATGIPLEAAPLVHAVNRLLARLGVVLSQQRRMVADAAHELRTPVAATRVQADNLAHADLPPEAQRRLESLQLGLGRISELIEQLLNLARVQGAAQNSTQRISLDNVVRKVIEETLPLAEAHSVDLGCIQLDAAEIRGDPNHAYALVRNVIDNAVRYTLPGGSVDVSVELRADCVLLIVQDTGPGIDPAQRERVFEPFFRILGSQQTGSGLGLAIVRSAAQALGGRVELGERADGRSRVACYLPTEHRMRSSLLTLSVLLSGCATYQPLTLPQSDALNHDVMQLKVDASTMPETSLASHRFDPSDGFDMTEVAMLAVVNNPDLRLARAEAGVTRAQAFSAGLLPDPQLALTRESVLGSPAGATVAFTAGLTIDLAALLAHSASKGAADAEARKSNLDLLWQEWQTVAKARLLFVKLDAIAQSQNMLGQQRTLLRERLDEAKKAVERGLVTNDAASPQLTAYEDVNRQWNDQERLRNQAQHDLSSLVGVAPDVPLSLVGSSDAAEMDDAQVRAAIAESPRRRPDLLALQAGLEAQDDRYRGAIRAQFPAITFGPTRGRDTSNVNTVGFSLGISLPLFNRNRGNIAIESATREKLRLDYQQRLNATVIESHRFLSEQAILRRQIADIDASLPTLIKAAEQARQAYEAHNIDALTLTNVESAVLARRLERIAASEALQEQAIALQALLGTHLKLPDRPTGAAGVNLVEKNS